MVQNNPAPLVVFALIAMIICGILGLVMGQNPFGPSQGVRDEQARTKLAMDVRATENALSSYETPQAIFAQQVVVEAQLTALPLQQTATQVAAMNAIENAQINATQTAIAGEITNKQLADQATQTALVGNQKKEAQSARATATAIAQNQVREQTTGIAGLAVVVIGALVIFTWLIVRIFAQATHARAEAMMAQAQFLAEQRRSMSLRASLENHNGHKPLRTIPKPTEESIGNIDRLPKVNK